AVVFVESGGTSIDSDAVGGGQIQLAAGAVGIGTILSANTFGAGLAFVAGLASNTQIVGGREVVYGGGVAVGDTIMSSFDGQVISSGGLAIDATILHGGIEAV